MTEWINVNYRTKKNPDLLKALDRMVYSWLLYYYYYSIKRSHKKLYGFQIVLDTNIIGYLLNINGNERKYYVEYLLEKMKSNNCSVVLNNFTIRELNNLLSSDDLYLIKLYRSENIEDVKQIKYNSYDYFKALFTKYGLNLLIKESKEISLNEKKYKDLTNDLRKYKELKKNKYFRFICPS
jgi:rRNA-processing protein FCF1